jgi:hypothetical protein
LKVIHKYAEKFKNINSAIMEQKAILTRLNTEVRKPEAQTIEL